jgi:hypothetical protein
MVKTQQPIPLNGCLKAMVSVFCFAFYESDSRQAMYCLLNASIKTIGLQL